MKKEIIVSVNDFEIICQYKLICSECEKEIISIIHPIDCDFIKCPICETKYFIQEQLEIT